VAFLLEGAECNISHGDRLNPSDKKRGAREIATSDPECKWTKEALAKRLGVIQQTVSTWISDIRAQQSAPCQRLGKGRCYFCRDSDLLEPSAALDRRSRADLEYL